MLDIVGCLLAFLNGRLDARLNMYMLAMRRVATIKEPARANLPEACGRQHIMYVP